MRKEWWGVIALTTLAVSELAFSYGSRREIGERDNWTCQSCGKSFQQGYMVQAAHYDHDKKKKEYDNPSNGRILCTSCHIDDELKRGNKFGAMLLKKRQTIFTYDRIQNPEKYQGIGERPKRRVAKR